MKKSQTPPEKKIRDYQNERRNAYGENDKASRKNLPRKKARANRSHRHAVRQVTRASRVDPDELTDQLEAIGRPRQGLKSPDAPLAVWVSGWPLTPKDIGESDLRAEAIRRNFKSGRMWRWRLWTDRRP